MVIPRCLRQLDAYSSFAAPLTLSRRVPGLIPGAPAVVLVLPRPHQKRPQPCVVRRPKSSLPVIMRKQIRVIDCRFTKCFQTTVSSFLYFPIQRPTIVQSRGGNKGLFVLLRRTQAAPGRAVKQEQEEISHNHV